MSSAQVGPAEGSWKWPIRTGRSIGCKKNLEHFQGLLLKQFSALQRQAMSQGTVSPTEAERQRINLALERIRRDEYWYCVTCGGNISEEHLLNDPTVLTCADCTSENKKED
ncbi:MAG: hypothetical protein SCI25_10680 [Desulfuromonadales bacterium]|nr:hypothetical protein [Desulfuromonadales bacterium]MDW7757377.1 hypothetical protein [Desulfuromonadales bacterium]